MKRTLLMTLAALSAVVILYGGLTLPAATTVLAITPPPTTVFGAYHIHTTRSDGSGSIDDVAKAAADAGLQFVILADHGDATRAPEAPAYRHGVLVIDGVEVSIREGHLVVLGLREAAPYPLGGESRDVIEDAHRLGAWTIAAHPDSGKRDLRWTGRSADGIEWINADSEWRDDSSRKLLQAALHYVVRPAPAIASLFARPQSTLRRWESWARSRPIVGLAAVDAHARIGLDEQSEPRAARTILARPSYEDMFRTVVQGVWLPDPPSGDAARDAARILDALRTGQTYSAVTAIAAPAVLTVTRTTDAVEAAVEGAPDAVVSVWHRGRELVATTGKARAAVTDPGLYRIEVRWPGQDVPWIVSAPVFVAPPPAMSATPDDPPSMPGRTIPIATGTSATQWLVEHHPATTTSWRADGAHTEWSFSLAKGSAPGQYAALVHPLDPSESFDEIRFTVEADRPMRFSVQVRLPEDAGGGERWVRSVYADPTPREVHVRLVDFSPAERETSRRPVAARLQSLLFVVDAPNTPPGATGTIRVSAVTLHAPQAAAEITSGR